MTWGLYTTSLRLSAGEAESAAAINTPPAVEEEKESA